jgi:hypothetical protein
VRCCCCCPWRGAMAPRESICRCERTERATRERGELASLLLEKYEGKMRTAKKRKEKECAVLLFARCGISLFPLRTSSKDGLGRRRPAPPRRRRRPPARGRHRRRPRSLRRPGRRAARRRRDAAASLGVQFLRRCCRSRCCSSQWGQDPSRLYRAWRSPTRSAWWWTLFGTGRQRSDWKR